MFDRIADLLLALLAKTPRADGSGGSGRRGFSASGGRGSRDPDLKEAWEELEEYLRTGRNSPRPKETAGRDRREDRPGRASPAGPGGAGKAAVNEALRPDYANLQVAFGAPFEEVRRSYKRLLQRYHPDRFAGDPEKQRTATLITQRIIDSYRRISQEVKKPGNR